jgi:hypothetical protein
MHRPPIRQVDVARSAEAVVRESGAATAGGPWTRHYRVIVSTEGHDCEAPDARSGWARARAQVPNVPIGS